MKTTSEEIDEIIEECKKDACVYTWQGCFLKLFDAMIKIIKHLAKKIDDLYAIQQEKTYPHPVELPKTTSFPDKCHFDYQLNFVKTRQDDDVQKYMNMWNSNNTFSK